jgi:methyl-accepting chemotaxis protein
MSVTNVKRQRMDAAELTPTASPAGQRFSPLAVVALLGLVAGALGCAALLGPAWVTMAMAAAAGLAVGAMGCRPAGDPEPAGERVSTAGAQALVSRVIPVWHRTTELARATAEREASDLAGRFANVHAQLDIALGATAHLPTLDGHVIDELLDKHAGELDRLRSDAREALDALGEALQRCDRVERSALTLTRLAGELGRLASGTHLLGLNASVEAARSGAAQGTFGVVAGDVRDLARQLSDVAAHVGAEVATTREQVDQIRRLGGIVGRDDEALALRTQINARAVLRSLLQSVGEATRSSQTLREAGQQAQAEVEAIMMGLQGHDRINQMLHSVIGDFDRMRETLESESEAPSPVEWLERLEASYTMEEMRTSHHGTRAVDVRAGVEFF